MSALDYGNGDKVQYEYDTQGRIVKETYLTDGETAGDTVTYKYDNSGALATVTDSASGISTTYYYDFTDRVMKYVETGEGFSHSVGYGYDKLNNLTSLVETIQKGGAITEHITTYTYDDDNRTTSVTVDGSTVEYAYDAFGRSNQQTTKHGETAILTDTFTFTAPSAQATSTQVSGHNITINDGQTLTRSYTYDDNGNILTIVRDGYETRYTYDAANQLVREDNAWLYITQTWEYDDAGNILSNTRYAYTTGSLEGLTPTAANTYSYGDDHWGDLLTSYNGQDITYDEIGNPASIGNRSFTWQNGRQLASQTYNGTTWTYSYNNAGLRTSRSNGVKTYHYVYNGDKLTQMTIVDEVNNTQQVVDFTYDAAGQLLTLAYDEEVYYYILSLQGDVAGITDSQGNRLIDFHYEGYGESYYTSYDTEKAALLAQINPFGYRSYVLDLGTYMYYLQSRYYDPALGRFINADAYVATGQGFIGNNMFAYCDNNPVVRVDHGGQFWETIFDVISLGASIVEVCVNPTDPWAWAGLAGDVIDLIPFVAGVGEVTRAVKTTVKVVDKATDVVDTAKTMYKTADAASDIRKATGSYEILYKSGKNYIGKGGFNRAITSASRNAAKYGDEVTSIMWKSAPNSRLAFMDEYLMQKSFGGVLSSNRDLLTYNKIWSPGRGYFGD